MSYTPIPLTDPVYDLLLQMDQSVTRFVVVRSNNPTPAPPSVYGSYASITRANRSARLVPLDDPRVCMLANNVPYWVGIDGRSWRV